MRFHGVGDKITRLHAAGSRRSKQRVLPRHSGRWIPCRPTEAHCHPGWLSCDAIVDLARKAAQDPAACDMLLKEIHEAIRS